MELFYRCCADPERHKQSPESERRVTCCDDSRDDGYRQAFVNEQPQQTFVMIRNDLDTDLYTDLDSHKDTDLDADLDADLDNDLDSDLDTGVMIHKPCQDPITLAMLTSHIARQLAIIGDEVNDLYRREFTGIMYDIGLTLNGNHGNRPGSLYSRVCEGLLCEVTVKRLYSLISHITSAKQSDSSTLGCLYKYIPQNIGEFLSDYTAILTSTSVIVTSCLVAVLAYKNSAR